MPMCGYHEKMGAGLQTFSEGVAHALREKASRGKYGWSEMIGRELQEIEIMKVFVEDQCARMNGDEHAATRRNAFLGLIYIADFLIKREAASGDGVGKGALAAGNELTDMLRAFENLYEAMPAESSVSDRTRAAWRAITP